MSQPMLPLIVKISSGLSAAIEMNVYLMPTVKLILVNFYSSTSMQTLHSAPMCSAIQLLVDTCLKDTHQQNV